ncbi:MAG TPA: hypothetical protein VLE43_20525 [Candidatus Saccharimonadia bacterium]|nr:hypothetical protein [Candidatus Saccharimonadia bacterium]
MSTARLLVLSTVAAIALQAAPASAAPQLKNPTKGDPALKTIGPISFGPDGLLLIAEPGVPAVVAVSTGDTGATKALAQPIADAGTVIAGALGTTADKIQIMDMAANASGNIYFSVKDNAAKGVAIIVISPDGKATKLDLSKLEHVRVALPKSETAAVRNLSDVAMTHDRVLVTGQSNEEFSSKIYSIPLPLDAAASGSIYSAETYHVAHGKWETKAPIQSFIPHNDNGTPCVLGAFACTPLAKFSLKDLSSGANVRGTSVVELGSGNRPLDVFAYTNAKGSWVVTNTQRFREPFFGPSKYWGVRISMDLINRNAPDEVNEKALRRNVKEPTQTPGIEILDSLSGAVQIDRLDDARMVVLREDGNKLKLEVAALP